MAGLLLRLLWIVPVVLLQVGHSVEQGSRSAFQQPYRGTTTLVNHGNQQDSLQQQVIVPGGFQHHLIQGNFPSLRAIDSRNARVIPSIQNGHFQLRNPALSPSIESLTTGRQRPYAPLLTGSTVGQRPAQPPIRQNSGSGQDLRAGETQYEYYDDTDGDIVYHYSNEDPAETSGGSRDTSSGVATVSKSIVPNESKKSLSSRGSQRGSQTSSFIPLVEDEEPPGQGLAYKGRSVQPQPSLRNSAAFGSNSNPTPLPGLLRNTSVITKNRSTPPAPAPPVPPSTRRPAVLRGPLNRFTLTSRPPPYSPHASASPSASRTLPSLSPSKSGEQISSSANVHGKTVEGVPGEDEYVEEYHDEDGDAYYEGDEELPGKGKPEKEADKSVETKTKVTVSVSTKTSSTTTPPPVVAKPRATPGPGIVISVATTRSISDKGNKGFRGSTTPPPTTPKVTFSRATGSSIVVASVQTSRSIATPSSTQQRLISSQHPPQDSSKSESEYTYEEEYPDNYPVLNGNPSESSLTSPSSTENIDKLDRVQSDLVNGVNAPQSSPSGSTTPQSKEVEEAVIPSSNNLEKQKKSLNFIASESDRPTEEIKSLSVDNLFKNLKFKDVSSLLPSDYQLSTPGLVSTTTVASTTTSTTTTTTSTTDAPTTAKPESSSTLDSLLASIKFEEANVSALLPKGYKPTFAFSSPKENKPITSTTSTPATSTTPASPPPSSTSERVAVVGESTPKITSLDSLLSKVKLSDISALLPPGYDESRFTTPSTTSEKPQGESGGGLVSSIKFDDISKFLPPGYKPPSDGSTTEAPSSSSSPSSTTTATSEASTTVKSLNKLVFPTRAGGLKFTRPSSTEAPKGDTPPPPKVTIQNGWPQRKTTEFTGWPTTSTLPSVVSTSTTESTTTTTTTTTTTERPTTTTLPPKRSPLSACTVPFCKMEAVLRIVGFRWKPEYGDINTEEWKHLERTVKRELDAAYRSSGLAQYYRSVEIEGFTRGSVIVDYFVILENVTTNLTSADVRALFHGSLPPSDQHDFSADNAEQVDKVALAADERLRLGRYVIDPKYTDFKVRNTTNEIHGASASEGIIPQWGIAVIVIGLASLMFVVIFGVTVLVNRHKNSKKKNAVSLTQEMLSEFNKTHSYGVDNYGADDLYNMDDVWNDKQPHMDRTFDRKPGKRASSSGKGSANYNIYDSWKTEWNGYYYNGNYYGDSGYAPSRRRSDYDTNF